MTASAPGPVRQASYAEDLGTDDPIEVMATTPDRLRKLVVGLTERQLSTRPAAGKWSIKEIIAHLADGEVVLGARYRFVAAHDRPDLAGYDQNAFVENLGVGNTRTTDLLDDFSLARAVNIGLFDRLPEDAFERVGVHAERGEESIGAMIAMYAGHDRHHLAQIETIRTGLFPRKKRARKVARRVAKKAPPARKAAGRAKKK